MSAAAAAEFGVRWLEVVAGIVRDRDGRVLVAQRPPGGTDAGLWEFPGGKLEPGEDAHTALVRELDEELGITVRRSAPLHRAVVAGPARTIALAGRLVTSWRGEPHGRQGQALRWVASSELPTLPMPRPDRPLRAALRLPRRYAVTPSGPPAAVRDGLERALVAGATLLQLRAPGLTADAYAELASAALVAARARGALLLLNASPALALRLDADGVQLSAAALARTTARPLPPDRLVIASCHDAAELAQAAAIDCDAAVLGPVLPTPTHPGATTLGWSGFEALTRDCALPVFAIGGLGPGDLARARRHGGFGVAGIRGFCGGGGQGASERPVP